MPETDNNINAFSYPMAKHGVNLAQNILELAPTECLQAQNCIFKNGIAKRGGQKKISVAEVNSGNIITGLHRFYKSDGTTKQLIASSGTDVRYDNSGTWTAISTGQTSGKQTHFATWGPLNKVYVANEADDPFSWDGSSKVQFSAFSSANIPSTSALMFLPYQDRLLVIEGGDLRWSASFADGSGASQDWETVASCGVRPDTKLYGMINHSQNDTTAGSTNKVLLAGANGMYLFSGTDLTTPFTAGNYTIHSLSTRVGCNAPRTMQWTPMGTIYLGIDRQVYLLQFNSATPVPISQKIHSEQEAFPGLETIPSAQIANACATYHNGFYILSVAGKGQSTNNTQWWLDISRLQKDENGHWGPWYGPMQGQDISAFAVQSGPGDAGELVGGEGKSTTGSYVYYTNDNTVFGDGMDTDGVSNGSAIQIYYQTFYHPLGNPVYKKSIDSIEAEILDVLGTVNVDFHDIQGSIKTGDSFGLSGSAIYYDDIYYNEDYYSSSTPTRVKLSTSSLYARRLSMIIKHSTSNDKFQLYGLSAEVKEGGLKFE